jgi:hypothetical protein
LATRYGRYSHEEFALDARPGRRYWMKAWRGAMIFQRAWDRYTSLHVSLYLEKPLFRHP